MTVGEKLDYIILIIGFVLLIKGADIFVDGSVAIARHFKIPAFIIGLTIVAFGTSAPEAAVSISAAVSGQNGIAVGNVLGSNLFNTLMVLGICSLVKPCPVHHSVLKTDIPFSIIATLLIPLLAVNFFVPHDGPAHLSRTDGIIFLILFILFIFFMIKRASTGIELESDEGKSHDISLGKGVILCLIGIVFIILGGQMVVRGASNIARDFGISDTLIGLTIVAIGTSLPELVTSAVASKKGENDIAVGNVVGSNIFNVLFVLGASVTVHPIRVSTESIMDSFILVAISLLVIVPSVKNREINKKWAVLFLAIYVAYMIYICVR